MNVDEFYKKEGLNPFGTGKVFKQPTRLKLFQQISLNPFGTGKVFKRIKINSYRLQLGLNPFGTGKVFKPKIKSNALFTLDVLIPSEQGKCSNLRQ